jgi:hypothetical protein
LTVTGYFLLVVVRKLLRGAGEGVEKQTRGLWASVHPGENTGRALTADSPRIMSFEFHASQAA